MPEKKMSWLALRLDFFDNKKIKIIEAMDNGETYILLWLKLLCEAGKCMREGRLELSNGKPITTDMLKGLLNADETDIAESLKLYLQFDMIVMDNETIIIKNWHKYQEEWRRLKNVRENVNRNVSKHREKQTEPKPKKQKKEPEPETLPSCIANNEANRRAWEEWKAYRKEKKKKLTPTTIKKQLAQLEQWHNEGQDILAIINQSIAAGWQGLFEQKGGGSGGHSKTSDYDIRRIVESE